ncbi:DMT family transporter [Alkalihalobacterium alkalinitrilicum]|uniref:DMT family transporter n=1 Tax=Alkalihalobacterium alkalinitrilicum TaxID=427920 RepID=UPI0009954745|nr:multidrug efflux SMR transporter [Alkalihalobacterium alkalinitrilicum]
MAWILLLLAGIFEMVGVVMINKLHQDRNWQALLYLVISFASSFLFLALSLQTLPMSTAYAIWTGIGAAGGAILAMVYYGEPKNMLRLVFIAIIIASTIGLKLVSPV